MLRTTIALLAFAAAVFALAAPANAAPIVVGPCYIEDTGTHIEQGCLVAGIGNCRLCGYDGNDVPDCSPTP